jgi:transposase InsO family protein
LLFGRSVGPLLRKVIGWAISRRIDAELCMAALRSALSQRQPPRGCIHHSDGGVQYACEAYVALLEEAHMQISMSRTANPYDNARIESFFKTLKYEGQSIYRTMRPTMMSPGGFLISSMRCTTKDDYIRPRGIYHPSNTRSRSKQPKLLIVLPSTLRKNSPARGAVKMRDVTVHVLALFEVCRTRIPGCLRYQARGLT